MPFKLSIIDDKDIPHAEVLDWYKHKRSDPIQKIHNDKVLPLILPDEAYEFFSQRMHYWRLPPHLLDEWAENRSVAITERNERRIQLSSMPLYVDVELNKMCNLKCQFCTCVHYHKKDERLTTNEISKLSKLYKYAEIMETSKSGEPFLTPDLFVYLLKEVRRINPFVIIHTVTNGTVLRDDLLKALIEYKLDHMYLSINSHNKELFKEMTIGGNFELILKNLQKIKDAKKELDSKEPYVHFNCQLSKYANPFKVLEIAKKYDVIEVNFVKTQPFGGKTGNEIFRGKAYQDYLSTEEIESIMDGIAEKASELRISVNFSGWDTKHRDIIGSTEKFYYPHITKYFDLSQTCPTDAPWFRFCTAMRKVQPCCWSGSFADWTKTSFKDIWNGEYLKGLRRQLSQGIYPKVCHCKY